LIKNNEILIVFVMLMDRRKSSLANRDKDGRQVE